MKLLACSPLPLDRRLGAAKVLVEFVEAMRALDWQCDLIAPADLTMNPPANHAARGQLAKRLREYLIARGGEYDVIDYDHEYLAFDRTDFPPRPLMVARSVLLVQHLSRIQLPQPRGLRASIGRLIYGHRRQR